MYSVKLFRCGRVDAGALCLCAVLLLGCQADEEAPGPQRLGPGEVSGVTLWADPRAGDGGTTDPSTARVDESNWPEACVDADRDGFPVCPSPVHFALDCDDSSMDVQPLGVEVCNGRDDDCDQIVDEGQSGCQDGLPVVGLNGPDPRAESVPGTLAAVARVAPEEWPDECVDADRDGYPACPGLVDFAVDCDDESSGTSPIGVELCNGLDDDCDGLVDEGRAHCHEGVPEAGGSGHGERGAAE